MLDFDYERWWSLHVRVAKGERLSDQEVSEYELGLDQLDGLSEEVSGDTLIYLWSLRAAVNRAAARHVDLNSYSLELDKKIADLESAYQELTGQTLNLGPHVPSGVECPSNLPPFCRPYG